MPKIFVNRPARRYRPSPPPSVEHQIAEQRRLDRELRDMIESDRQRRMIARAEKRAAERQRAGPESFLHRLSTESQIAMNDLMNFIARNRDRAQDAIDILNQRGFK